MTNFVNFVSSVCTKMIVVISFLVDCVNNIFAVMHEDKPEDTIAFQNALDKAVAKVAEYNSLNLEKALLLDYSDIVKTTIREKAIRFNKETRQYEVIDKNPICLNVIDSIKAHEEQKFFKTCGRIKGMKSCKFDFAKTDISKTIDKLYYTCIITLIENGLKVSLPCNSEELKKRYSINTSNNAISTTIQSIIDYCGLEGKAVNKYVNNLKVSLVSVAKNNIDLSIKYKDFCKALSSIILSVVNDYTQLLTIKTIK